MARTKNLETWLANEGQPLDNWSPLRGTPTQVALVEAAVKNLVKAIPTRIITKDMPRVAQVGFYQELITGVPALRTAPQPNTPLLRAMLGRKFIDYFAGFGGVTCAALANGLQVESYNHNPHAVAVGALNFDGRHFVADLGALPEIIDELRFEGPGQVPMEDADFVWNSAPCPPHSQARVTGRQSDKVKATEATRREALMKARLAADAVFAYLDVYRPPFLFTENVPPFGKWAESSGWLAEWDRRGYTTTVLSLNSRFFGVAQSRDRLVYVHARNDVAHKIDLTFTAPAWCPNCHRDVEGRQQFKNGRAHGSYGRQWIMVCPACATTVQPANGSSMAQHIDFADIGTPVADRKAGFDQSRARIAAGIDRLRQLGLPPQPILIRQDFNSDPAHKRPGLPVSGIAPTIGCRQVFGLAFHPALMPGNDNGPLAHWPTPAEMTFRMVKPIELAGLMGFPNGLHLGDAALGNLRYAAVMLGNAVPPPLAGAVIERAAMALAS